MRTPLPIRVAMAAALWVGPASAVAGQAPGDDAIAVGRTSGFTISRAELLDEIADARRSGDMVRMTATLDVEGLEKIVRAVADEKRLGREARARGIHTRADVARELARMADVVLAEALEGQVRAEVDTSDAAVRRFFEAHTDEFRSPGQRRARHIVVATEAEARAARAEIRGDRSFAEVASARNTDSTRTKGGELGWVARGVMVKVFEDALFGLKEGQISEPVRTSAGWHLILVQEIDPGALPPLALITDRVVATMKARAFDELRDRLRAEQPVTIDRAALQEILK